jgi:hypothetical protein
MPIDELVAFLKEGRSIYGYGCLSEPYRLFSGVADEVELAELGGAHPDSFENLMALSSTLRRLSKCVPLVLEDPRSFALAQHWFPQVASAFTKLPRLKVASERNVTKCQLSPQARAVLEALTRTETLLYRAVLRRVERMLAHLEDDVRAPRKLATLNP